MTTTAPVTRDVPHGDDADRPDAIVVGAGPAGSTAAHDLSRAGVRTLLLERHEIPREKACGDALLPDALGVLRELGALDDVRAAGHDVRTCRIHAPNGTPFEVSGEFLTVARRDLDARLAAHAVRAGATLCTGARVTGFEADSDGATVHATTHGRPRSWRTRIVLVACGADAGTLGLFGLVRRRASSAVAMRAYWRLRPDVDEASIRIWYEKPLLPGYGWIFPMGRGLFNVGVGVVLVDLFATRCAAARDDLRGGAATGPPRGAQLRTSLVGARPSGERVLACGEAVGATCAFTGEGIGKAMQTAQEAAAVAADALASGRTDAAALRTYDERLESRFRALYRQYDTAQAWLRHPWVCNLVARASRRSPRVRRALEDAVAERGPPTAVFSFIGLSRALLFR